MIKAALITVSTSRDLDEDGSGEPDLSGERLAALAGSIGAEVIGREPVPSPHLTLPTHPPV